MNTLTTRKEQSHDRIVEAAARAIRRAGFHGVGIADIMKEAGLTHGGFYAHFASRNALLAEAMACAWRGNSVRAEKEKASRLVDGPSPFRALVEGYLSERHLAATETGCPVAGLASEMPRQASEVRTVAAQCVREMFAAVQRALSNSPPDRCALIASQMVGTLQLARVLGGSGEGKALLTAARRDLLSKYDTNSP
jgi:TetR/AcrR family transcriptional repressor of nem operon